MNNESELAENKRLNDMLIIYAYSQRPGITPTQRRLSRIFIDPILPTVEHLIADLRKEADSHLLASFSDDEWLAPYIPNTQHPTRYPFGYCNNINDFMFDRMRRIINSEESWDSSDLRAIGRFIHEGGIFTKVYGIVCIPSGRFFQNSMLLGSWILDSAADSAESSAPLKTKTRIWPADNGLYKPIDSFIEFAKVCEEYYGMRIYPTKHHLPILAPFMPIISITAGGYLHFPFFSGLFFYNILNDFKPSKEFLLDSEYSSRNLPAKYVAGLRNTFRSRRDTFKFHEAGRLSVRDVFKEIDSMFSGVLNGMPLDVKKNLMNIGEYLNTHIDDINRRVHYFTYR